MQNKMSAFENLLGAEVLNERLEKVNVSTFIEAGGVIGLYFSAHWCPPCRGFTPQLATFYKTLKGSGKGHLEIVFVSSDNDESQWREYFGEMPWLALPYEDRGREENLSKKYGVRGIPTLVLLDAVTGKIINANARMAVVEHMDGEGFPWRSAGSECNCCTLF